MSSTPDPSSGTGGTGGSNGSPASGITAPHGWLRVAPIVVALAWGGNHFVPLMQLYEQVFGYSTVEVDLFLASYVIGLVPGFALAGAWSDRFGRKPVMLVGLLIGVIGSVILATASFSVIGMSVGRLVSGVSVAVGMVVGSSWIKELSVTSGRSSSGARRSALSLTAGFGGGAGIAGVLAQFAPLPTLLPYLVQIAATMLAGVVLLRAPETRMPDPAVRSLLGDLRIPRHARRRFVRVVLPLAPWVFAAPALAFAVGPSLVAEQTGALRVGFATLATVVTLGTGTVVQLLSAPIARLTRGRSGVVGLAFIAGGALLLIAAAVGSGGTAIAAVLIAAPLFGAGYGPCMVFGLGAVQDMATPHDLAGLTAVYYSMTYAGFFLPAILAVLAPLFSFPAVLIGTAVVIAACATAVALRLRSSAT
ncbi:MFS transporter [Schumannella sp. 10F1B-5-1]|uniref:MFS transporter n=1 Tax=Schumannella sp. 10F1B-5-1 TaxID=2590780 RepID=UPI001132114C|nr:MFS transporter [Schumannella sp. 10F1B-5-1]TPW71580.1 MFS transporter [Schumannella sp. 10F1B-5-1]